MSNKKLGTEPAFGYPAHTDINDEPGYGRLSNTHNEEKGMSKRLWIATQLLQGCINKKSKGLTIEEQVRAAYYFTDELLKQENE